MQPERNPWEDCRQPHARLPHSPGPTGLDVAVVSADAAPARAQRRGVDAVARVLHLLLFLPDLLPVPDQEHVMLQHEVPARGEEARLRRSLSKRLLHAMPGGPLRRCYKRLYGGHLPFYDQITKRDSVLHLDSPAHNISLYYLQIPSKYNLETAKILAIAAA